MKRALVLMFCLTLLAGTGFAQQLGLKGGATYATLKEENKDHNNYRIGYTGGLFLQRHVGNMIGVQVEALYTSKGGRTEILSGGNLIADEFRLNYIDVPVLLHLSASGVFVDLGPQVSFIASAAHIREVTSDSGNKSVITKSSYTDNVYTIDFGYVGSIGYRAGNGVGLEVRYTGGLKKVDDERTYERTDRRNSAFSLMASYLLSYSR